MDEADNSKGKGSRRRKNLSSSDFDDPLLKPTDISALGIQPKVSGLGLANHALIANTVLAELSRKITSPVANTVLAELSRKITSPIADSVLARMLLINQFTPSFMKSTRVTWVAQLAESLGSRTIANAFASSLAINGLADHILEQNLLIARNFELATQFSVLSKSTRALTDWARINTVGITNFSSSVSSLAALRKYVGGFSTNPTTYQLENAVLGSVATRSFMEIELLDSNAQSENLGEIVSNLENNFTEISNRERVATAGMLMETLSNFDPAIEELLRGGWEELASPRAAAVSKIANCAVEAIDRTLRTAAPDDEVLLWLCEQEVIDDYLHLGKPTRRARIVYILRKRSSERRLVLSEEANFAASARLIHSNLESAKHGDTVSIAQARALLVAAESFLTQLFL